MWATGREGGGEEEEGDGFGEREVTRLGSNSVVASVLCHKFDGPISMADGKRRSEKEDVCTNVLARDRNTVLHTVHQ